MTDAAPPPEPPDDPERTPDGEPEGQPDRRRRKRVRRYLRLMFEGVAGADNERHPDDYHLEASDTATVDRINRRVVELARERAGLRLVRTFIVIACGGIPIAFILVVPDWGGDADEPLQWVVGAVLAYIEFFLLILLLFVRAQVASLNARLQLVEYELVLTTFTYTHEKTAANLFFKHQVELKQYYDQTLRQNRQAFVVGIVCVGFGLAAIVAVAALVLTYSNSTTPAKITAAGLGILSALLTGFVARVYLRVYEGSSTALGAFHDRLVNTNHFHFANLLASLIQPDEARMSAISRLAEAIAARPAITGSEERNADR